MLRHISYSLWEEGDQSYGLTNLYHEYCQSQDKSDKYYSNYY